MLFRLDLEKSKKSEVGVLPHSGGKTPFDWGITPKGGRFAPEWIFNLCSVYMSMVSGGSKGGGVNYLPPCFILLLSI